MKREFPNRIAWGTGELLAIAKNAYARAKAADALKGRERTTGDAHVAIVFAAGVTEAYISSAVGSFEFLRQCNPKLLPPKVELFTDLLGALDEKEAGSNVKAKYNLARWVLCGKPYDKGCAPFQDFSLLIDLRNALMHLKPERAGVIKFENILRELHGRKLIKKIPMKLTEIARSHWVAWIHSAELAKWACNTASAMIQGFWADAPEPEVRHFFHIEANAAHFTPVA